MTVPLPILDKGKCEPFKALIHGTTLGLCALMGMYNAAAWINRRERHLAINAIVYGLAVAFEQRHVVHHITACRQATPLSPHITVPAEPVRLEPCDDYDALKVA